ncbi:hypothetical protein V493_04574 [Pseudogymnoascus sp. VKM F-4281 (FW-2241)]|nr:hypothetical protein V493_04574 [Pseudogymnoascus sp. VKM F-4281 (FW-2241)]
MAEAIAGLAVASSVITVIDTTCKVVAIGWKCYKGLKTPPKELVEVLSELMSLKGILDTVHSHLSTLNDHSSKDFLALEVLDQTDGVLSACAAVLQDVLRIIEDLQKKKLSSVIAAATSGQKFLETKNRIERLKGILILALSCDHITLSHAIEEYLHLAFGELQQGQEKIHCELLNIDNHIAKLSLASEEMASSHKEKHEADRYNKTLRWLSIVDVEANHLNACKLQQPGTGFWLIEGEKFSEWAEEENSTFWLHAIPGAGKTILCSTVIKQLQSRSRPVSNNLEQPPISTTIYFYFDFRNTEQQHTEGMLSSLLGQLANKLTKVPEEICTLLEIEDDIQKSLSGNSIYSAAIESADVALDVELFVETQIKATESLRDLNVGLRDEIVQQLVSGAKGMKVPMGCLSIGYSEVPWEAKGNPECSKKLATNSLIRRTLQFVIFAVRPMTMQEIAEAVVIEDCSTALDTDDRFPIPEHLVKNARSLLTITNGYLGLSHYSVQEYLQSPKISTSPVSYFAMTKSNADEEIGRKCLTYLAYDDFNIGPCESEKRFFYRLINYPFLEYAAKSWFIHSHEEPAQRNVAHLFEEVWTTVKSPKYLTWYQAFCCETVDLWPKYDTYQTSATSIVYYPALWGLHVLLEGLLIRGANVNIQGGYYGQALQAASVNQNWQCFKLLLDHGADVHAQGGDFGNALQASAFAGCEYMVKALLEKHCRVDTEGGVYGNALYAASFRGHTKIINMLIEAGADVNARGKYGYALMAAATNGHELTCEVLINKGALVNVQTDKFDSGLDEASLAGRNRVVELLLKRGAEVDASRGWHCNAIGAACYMGHEQIVRVLLIHGADVSSSGSLSYASPLEATAMNGFTKVMSLLIQYGAGIGQRDGVYALIAAARNGQERAVSYLLDLGVNINGAGTMFDSALGAACENGSITVVRMLLNRGADPNVHCRHYGNPLQAAAVSNSAEIVRLLLENGAKVNALGGKFHTALHGAATGGYENIVEMLLMAGADVSIVGGGFGRALDEESIHGYSMWHSMRHSYIMLEGLKDAEKEKKGDEGDDTEVDILSEIDALRYSTSRPSDSDSDL